MTSPSSLHEDFQRDEDVKAGSERAFGYVFAAVFAIIGLLPMFTDGPVRIWPFVIAGLFLATALLVPRLLSPLNVLWFRFGMLLHIVVNPLVMGFLFFVTVTPTALVMRLFGKDPLRLRLDKSADSYWIERTPPGPAPETMRQQF